MSRSFDTPWLLSGGRCAGLVLSCLCLAVAARPAPFGATNSDTSLYGLGDYVLNVVFVQDDRLRDPVDIAHPPVSGGAAGELVHFTPDDLLDQRQHILDATAFWNDHPINQGFHPNAQLNLTVNFLNAGQPLTIADAGDASNRSPVDGLGSSTDLTLFTDALTQIDPAYGVLGFEQGTRALNRDTRDAFDADWAFTTFVRPFEPRTANARLNGPLINAFLDSNTYVHAHEIAHMFGALDQYAPNRNNARGGYLDVQNVNAALLPDDSPNPDHVETIMSTFGLFNFSDDSLAQIGWIDTDADTIPDILDTEPRFFFTEVTADLDARTLTGILQTFVDPLPSPRQFVSDATINTIVAADYRLNGGDWAALTPTDGVLGDAFELFSFTLTDVPVLDFGGDAFLTFEARVTNSVGNTSVYAQTFGVPEPTAATAAACLALIARRRRA